MIEFHRQAIVDARVLRNQVTVSLNGFWLCAIPAGFKTDGLSRPWYVAWRWRRWDKKYLNAAVLHDYLLTDPVIPKWQADWLFMGALRSQGVSALEAGIFWLAVRTRRPVRRV